MRKKSIKNLLLESIQDTKQEAALENLSKLIQSKVKSVLMSSYFGFDEDDIEDYTYVDVFLKEDYVCVEVRAELSYEGMMRLGDNLNKVVQSYDPDSYFDMESPGIMTAFISKSHLY